MSSTGKIWEACGEYVTSGIPYSGNSRLTSREQWYLQLWQNRMADLFWHPGIEQFLSIVGIRTQRKYSIKISVVTSVESTILIDRPTFSRTPLSNTDDTPRLTEGKRGQYTSSEAEMQQSSVRWRMPRSTGSVMANVPYRQLPAPVWVSSPPNRRVQSHRD